MAEEIRRTEAEWQQAKLREAEKRKREAAAMEMPPPDSWECSGPQEQVEDHAEQRQNGPW